MMRPACAYPQFVQNNLQNGQDLYADREGFGFGIVCNQNPSVQTIQSTSGLYSMPAPGPAGMVGNSGTQHFQAASAFSTQTYSQMPPFSTQMPAEVMPQGALAPSFQTQQPAFQTVITPSGEKLISSNLPPGYARGSNLNGPINQPTSSSYGPIVGGPGNACNSVPQQRLPAGTTLAPVGNGRNLSQSPMTVRPGCTRSASGIADSNGFANQSMYTPYPPGSNANNGVNVQIPYTISISNTAIPSTVSPGGNKSNMPPMAPYHSAQPLMPQSACAGTGHMGRSPCCPAGAPTMPQGTAGYSAQQPRPPICSSAYITGSYPVQHYASSASFRAGSCTLSGTQPPSLVQRPLQSPSPQVSKESPGLSGVQVHPSIAQQSAQLQSSQLSVCPSTPSDSSNPCSSYPSTVNCKGHGLPTPRSGSTGPSGPMFNNVTGCGLPSNMVGPHTSITPPGSIVLNGPGQPLGQSTVLGGCLPIGCESDVKLSSGVPDGCYLQSRPMSSGPRDPSISTLTANGPMGSCSDLLMSSTFPMSNNLNASNLVYAPNQQQIPILPGDFDAMNSNPSPMMMMTMNSSSPVPGGPLMNGAALPTGVMNIAMANSAPAPPPYHQTAPTSNCRSLGSSIFFGTSAIPSVTGATSIHSNGVTVLPDGSAAMTADRHFMSIPGDNTIITTGGKQQPSGTTKTARPKRTRSNKAAPGTGRSKASTKKANAATASAISRPPPTGPNPDPFAMNIRMPTQQQPLRQKLSTWNMCPASMTANFPSGMTSPPLSLPIGADGRTGCISPASFSSPSGGVVMRPNSGPPVNSMFAGMPHVPLSSGPVDSNIRSTASPRQYPAGQGVSVQQQQHYAAPANPGSTPPTGPLYFANQPNHPSQTSNLVTSACTTAAAQQQMQSHLTNYPPTTRTSSSLHFQSQPLSGPQQLPMTSNRLPTHPPNNSASRGFTSQQHGPEPISSDKLSAPPYSSPVPTATAPGVVPPVNLPGETDRLVCPITNGMVWGPTQISLADVMHQFLPGGIHVCRFEFDLTANHLNTIVGRSDLDIVVCSHLLSEPLQVCHWPSDAVQIRFNEYLLRLDRSSVGGGQSAHKVACVKQLCRPGRNQLEIAILGLGEDPSQAATMNKRHTMAGLLETHRFAAFMAHMPALNVLLDGLKRRRPAGVNALCDILEGRVGSRSESSGSLPSPARPTPVVAELNLVCPVFRTRMNVPGRIMGCEHVEAFDMEAFLRREVLWPRLNCPICRHKSPAGLDGLCIDTTILNALNLVHPAIETILVRSDGYWRLPAHISLDLPPDVDQWQPVIGPLTETVTQAFSSMAMVKTGEARGTQPSSATACTTPDWNTGVSGTPSTPQRTGQSRPNCLSRSKSGPVGAPPLTPGKEVISSPPWPVWSGSPSVQEKIGGPQSSESGSNEGASNVRQPGATRPSSQPITWLGMQSSPHEQRITLTPQHTQSPRSSSDSSNACQYPSTDLVDSKYQTTLRQPISAYDSTIPHRSTDAFDGNSKPRRSSTGSTRLTALGTETVSTLPTVPEHMIVSQTTQMGWSDSVSSSSRNGSPSRTPLSASHAGSSLPTSPTLVTRPVASSNSFALASIPGVNMHPTDHMGPNITSPSTSVGPMGVSVCQDSICKSLPREPSSFESRSPSASAASTTTTYFSTVTSEESIRAMSKPQDHALIEISEEEIVCRRGANESECSKKPTSSLNMGLDFLLSEENSVVEQTANGAQNSNLVAQVQPLGDQSSLETGTTASDLNPLDACDRPHSCQRRNTPNIVPIPNTVSSASDDTAKTSYHCRRFSGSSDTNGHSAQLESNPIVKRIKLDPESIDSEAIESDLKGGSSKNCFRDSSEDSQSVVVDLKKSEDEKSQLPSPFPKQPTSPSSVGRKQVFCKKEQGLQEEPCPNGSFTSTNDRFFNEHLCSDSIHSLSAQIDRIEAFLDESYICFVENFPCV
ncbi:hypothetical protein CRM22_008743 [Opisthorchis felineus]|uniref:Uncharacterized protein n=1 Tax=Opisthorchis felineus TaxID=147828 RepID=A0A4S2LGZ5_OPIFE|nr:hypothetical protein CRM22_008743 [Opisthorchis felineus]